jgi:hypothetical protein
VTGRALPSAAREAENPVGADREYEEAISILRERTRDSKRFRLLFNENADYGFRRNSLAIRRLALGVALVVLVLSLALLGFGDWRRWAISAGISFACAVYWWRIVRPEWVRDAAEAYADRLLATVDALRRE